MNRKDIINQMVQDEAVSQYCTISVLDNIARLTRDTKLDGTKNSEVKDAVEHLLLSYLVTSHLEVVQPDTVISCVCRDAKSFLDSDLSREEKIQNGTAKERIKSLCDRLQIKDINELYKKMFEPEESKPSIILS